jgi:C1A family cysteine protease
MKLRRAIITNLIVSILLVGIFLPISVGNDKYINEIQNNSFYEELIINLSESNVNWQASDYIEKYSSYMSCGSLDNSIVENPDVEYEIVEYKGNLPSSFDWRDVDGVDWTTPVRDQAGCGSCAAFATNGAFESVVQIETGVNFGCDLSEAYLFFCGGRSCDGGWFIDSAVSFFQYNGVPDEACFPYVDVDTSCDQREENWPTRLVYATETGSISNSVSNIQNALLEYGPLATNMEVYSDFFGYRSGVYEYVSGEFEGHHAIIIVGYDDADQSWICKNSWGVGWGMQGWFKMKYNECTIGTYTFYFNEVYGNIQPYQASNPYPEDKADEVNIEIELNWDDCIDLDGDNVFYDIYLAEGYNVDENDLIADNHQTSSYFVEGLKKNTKYTWKIVAEDQGGAQSLGPEWIFTTRGMARPTISGPNQGNVNTDYDYTGTTIEHEGDQYYWWFDWGDGTNSDWLGPTQPGDTETEYTVTHSWSSQRDYNIRVKYKEDGKEVKSDNAKK